MIFLKLIIKNIGFYILVLRNMYVFLMNLIIIYCVVFYKVYGCYGKFFLFFEGNILGYYVLLLKNFIYYEKLNNFCVIERGEY